MPPIPAHAAASLSLDETLAPVADFISNSWRSDSDVSRVIGRLIYLTTGGPARIDRAELAMSICVSAMEIFLEDIRNSSPSGEMNWFRLAKATGMSPRDARKFFSGARP